MRTFLLALLIGCAAESAEAADRIHIWLKAFIPNAHPGNPSYVKPVPGRAGQTMIPPPSDDVPLLPKVVREWILANGIDGCFVTDNRTFSTSPTASARLTTEFVLVINGDKATIEKAADRAIKRCDTSEMVNCASGASKKTGKATPKYLGGAGGNGIGVPQVTPSQVQVIFQSGAANPLAPAVVTPDIDASLDVIYDKASHKLKFRATLGVFPAFEAYASLNDGPVKKLFAVNPVGDTVWSLYDLGGTRGTRDSVGEIAL